MLIEGRREVRGDMNRVVSSGQLGPAVLMDYTSTLLGKWTPPTALPPLTMPRPVSSLKRLQDGGEHAAEPLNLRVYISPAGGRLFYLPPPREDLFLNKSDIVFTEMTLSTSSDIIRKSGASLKNKTIQQSIDSVRTNCREKSPYCFHTQPLVVA